MRCCGDWSCALWRRWPTRSPQRRRLRSPRWMHKTPAGRRTMRAWYGWNGAQWPSRGMRSVWLRPLPCCSFFAGFNTGRRFGRCCGVSLLSTGGKCLVHWLYWAGYSHVFLKPYLLTTSQCCFILIGRQMRGAGVEMHSWIDLLLVRLKQQSQFMEVLTLFKIRINLGKWELWIAYTKQFGRFEIWGHCLMSLKVHLGLAFGQCFFLYQPIRDTVSAAKCFRAITRGTLTHGIQVASILATLLTAHSVFIRWLVAEIPDQ